jgi:hypothetical protein
MAWTMISHFKLPTVTGMTGTHHHAQLFSVEMSSWNFFFLTWAGLEPWSSSSSSPLLLLLVIWVSFFQVDLFHKSLVILGYLRSHMEGDIKLTGRWGWGWGFNWWTSTQAIFFLQYWDLNSGPTPWATPPALFCDGFFQDRVSGTISPGLFQTLYLLISASWLARITGVSHQRLAGRPWKAKTWGTFLWDY